MTSTIQPTSPVPNLVNADRKKQKRNRGSISFKTEKAIAEQLDEDGNERESSQEGKDKIDVTASIDMTNSVESVDVDDETTRKKSDRYVTYKVHQLDWFDVESRIKLICNEMLKPVADIATHIKST